MLCFRENKKELEFGLQAKQSLPWAACGTVSNKPKYSILIVVHCMSPRRCKQFQLMNQDPQAGIHSWYDASMRTIHEFGFTDWYLVMV